MPGVIFCRINVPRIVTNTRRDITTRWTTEARCMCEQLIDVAQQVLMSRRLTSGRLLCSTRAECDPLSI